MRIIRHCDERLPGGTRLWRRLARISGYDGPLYLRGAGTDRVSKINPIDGSHSDAYTQSKGGKIVKIVVYLGYPHCSCAKYTSKRGYYPVFAFAHELGHAWQLRNGRKLTGTSGLTYKQWSKVSAEHSADRYAAHLLKRAKVDWRKYTWNWKEYVKNQNGLRHIRPW